MRLAINYIEIENFKSYYGKNILGPFHKSFNSVIGPNGSGKSNVIDSLLFVFGFRAQKLRTKKISVLIHNSEKHQNINSCSVTIYFHKINEISETEYEIIANSEFTIKRSAYKDNSSDYYIDNRRVQYKEISELLISNGVDLDHNRFLILQGEVESISQLKAKAANEHEEGLLEYLEDIIGTIKFRPLLEQASIEIEKTNETRAEKLNRVTNLQKDKDALEGPKNEAIKYLKLENELILKKNCLYQIKYNEINDVVENGKRKCNEIQNELNELNNQLSEFNKTNEIAITECGSMKKEYEKKQKLNDKLKKKFEDFEKEDVHIREGIKHAQEQIKKLKKNIDNETEKIKKFEAAPNENPEKIAELESKVKELENERENLTKTFEKLMDQVNDETIDWQKQKSEKQLNLNELQKSVNETKSQMTIAQSEMDVYLDGQRSEQNKLDDIRKNLENLTKLSEDRNKGIKDLEIQIPNLEKSLKESNEELADIISTENDLTDKTKKVRDKYSEAQSSFAANRNSNRVLTFLMQLKSEGKLDGLYGRLGDLGAIDEKYDVAISTACGALDCILVDTIDTATKCVEYLKANNVGSASFIALDKQEKWREHLNKRPNTPENVARLVDLIQVKDKAILPAFYYSLRNTLVADNLEQASRIAYGQQRNRVVTLKGEIIEISGTMTGGGRPQKGRMGSKLIDEYSAESIKDMQQTLQANENRLREIVKRKQELEPKIYELKSKLDESKENLIKWKNEIQSIKDQIVTFKKSENDCVKRLKEIVPDETVLRKLEQNIDKCKQHYEKADNVASKVREEIDELHEKIMNTNKRILDKPKKTLENLEEQIKDANNNITSLNVEMKSAARNLANSEKKLNSLNEDLEQNESKQKSFEDRLKEIDAEGKELIEEHEKLKEEIKNLEKEISEKTQLNKDTEKNKQKIETNKIDLNHKLEKLMQNLNNDENQLKHYKHLIDSLKLHGVDIDKQESNNSDTFVLHKYTNEELNEVDTEELKDEMHNIEENLKQLNPNLNAIQNYKELQTKYLDRLRELEEVTAQRDLLIGKYDELSKQRRMEFLTGFNKIKLKLKEIYRTVTLEGDAELEFVDSLDPFTEGIQLTVRPPKKSWKNISNLSGGEKTLSSLSLVFALHEYRATPIYVMDEIDAALDFKNVSIIAHYIKERTKNAQFIIISLRNNMFELADRLFGIYKVSNCTRGTYISPQLCELEDKTNKTKNNDQNQQQKPDEIVNLPIVDTNNETLKE